MKLTYFPDTDTLYIDLADRPSMESEVVNDNLIIDLDGEGRPVGITVEHYSQTVTTQTIEVNLPGERSPAAIKPSPNRQRHPTSGHDNGEHPASLWRKYSAFFEWQYHFNTSEQLTRTLARQPIRWSGSELSKLSSRGRLHRTRPRHRLDEGEQSHRGKLHESVRQDSSLPDNHIARRTQTHLASRTPSQSASQLLATHVPPPSLPAHSLGFAQKRPR